MIEIPLDHESETPLYRQIAFHLKKMIEKGALPAGLKLPGSRKLAKDLGVGRVTVTEAYSLLSDYGYVIERGRSGTYVTPKVIEKESIEEETDTYWNLDTVRPSADLIPSLDLSRIARDVLAFWGHNALCEAPHAGLNSLRQVLVEHSASRGIPASWKDVFVTAGGRHGLALSIEALKNIGIRKMWVEKLTYPDAVMIAHSEGVCIEVLPPLEEITETWYECLSGSDVLYLVPSFQNPTGKTISVAVRQMILQASSQNGFWILEDDAYGELRYGEASVSALKAMENSERVLYLGSFSQVLFPGLRLGYALIPDRLMEVFLSLQASKWGPVSSLDQFIVQKFIENKGLESALESARGIMESRMKALGSALSAILPTSFFTIPDGGIYLWLHLPGLDGWDAAQKACHHGVLVTPGNVFSLDEKRVEAVRLSVCGVSSEHMNCVVQCLYDAWGSFLRPSVYL
ncbi:MAG: PLP-dependent aminotransferase family protein [Aminobacterium sp.]|uniref:aminotransferase-like domain-containing protein n=1 Tax=Aminobacterium sp. TaxID=1872491 RepID=UPI002B1F1DE9|nr:PLP-dependent aminotransferase family protein [Aminobacterium sp.]MEA4878524.1 PLP-dependent aminotransferase family protein [Aminobacterium sp.]